MDSDEPSMTAMTAAAARAAHPLVDHEPLIFTDPLATALLGDQAEPLLAYHRQHGTHPVLAGARVQAVCRSRYAEHRVELAAAAGVTQYVVLGAGLDSFAHRSPLVGQVRVFEVDHPATQRWKRRRVSAAGLPEPGALRYAPVDFETDELAACLERAGFDPGAPAVVSWLGVTMYLTRPAITATLSVIGSFAAGTELVMDYLLPQPLRDRDGQLYAEQVAAVAAERGEPWLACFAPQEMTDLLNSCGFAAVEHVDQLGVAGPEIWRRTDALRPARLAVLAHATVTR